MTQNNDTRIYVDYVLVLAYCRESCWYYLPLFAVFFSAKEMYSIPAADTTQGARNVHVGAAVLYTRQYCEPGVSTAMVRQTNLPWTIRLTNDSQLWTMPTPACQSCQGDVRLCAGDGPSGEAHMNYGLSDYEGLPSLRLTTTTDGDKYEA